MTGQSIKAITTTYKGYRFRSRLEARWAVFYDALGVKWEYEKEGYDLGEGNLYLPDFYLPDLKLWIEIKPCDPSDREFELAELLADQSGMPVYIFGMPEVEIQDSNYDNEGATLVIGKDLRDYRHVWCECPTCGRVGIEFDGRSDRLPCKIPKKGLSEHRIRIEKATCPRSRHGDKGYNFETPRLIAARNAARGARFEHGESGKAKRRSRR